MTRCVVVLGLLCVEMCLVQSWFGLRSFVFFFLNLARRCYCCLLRWSACLLISSFFWDCIYFIFVSIFIFWQYWVSPHEPSPSPPAPRFSRPHTHTSTHHHAPQPHLTPREIPLFALSWMCLRSLTVALVFLQSRKASEQAKSVDSKTDSIGSGRAIPIKQVSTFTYFYPHISLVSISIFSSEVMFLIGRVESQCLFGSLGCCVPLWPLDGDMTQQTRWIHHPKKMNQVSHMIRKVLRIKYLCLCTSKVIKL